jgi:hypothetical protein
VAVAVAAPDAGVVATAADAGVVATAADAGVPSVVPSLDAPLSSVKGFYDAVKAGNGWLAAMFLLFFLVGFLRVAGKKLHSWIPDDTSSPLLKPVEKLLRFVFDTKLGGWLLNWASAVGGCLSVAAMAGAPVDAAAWKVAILASTGGTALIELKDDVMEWWTARLAKAAALAKPPDVVAPPVASV